MSCLLTIAHPHCKLCSPEKLNDLLVQQKPPSPGKLLAQHKQKSKIRIQLSKPISCLQLFPDLKDESQ
jgi:hypothetical protein